MKIEKPLTIFDYFMVIGVSMCIIVFGLIMRVCIICAFLKRTFVRNDEK
jgi:hypothetical protein